MAGAGAREDVGKRRLGLHSMGPFLGPPWGQVVPFHFFWVFGSPFHRLRKEGSQIVLTSLLEDLDLVSFPWV